MITLPGNGRTPRKDGHTDARTDAHHSHVSSRPCRPGQSFWCIIYNTDIGKLIRFSFYDSPMFV